MHLDSTEFMDILRTKLTLRSVLVAVGFLPIGAWAQTGIVINEIHYNPDVKTELVEFIELYNPGMESADLSGWRLSNAVQYDFPSGTVLQSGDYLLIAENPTAVSLKYRVSSLGPWVGKLANEGDTIVLRNEAGQRVDRVDYQLGFPWPTIGDAPGNSIQLVHPSLNNDLGGSWRSAAGTSTSSGAGVLISDNSDWRYFKGTREASSPRSDWRRTDFNDSAWVRGTAPIGYGEGFVSTLLSDMRGRYTSVFMRKTFDLSTPGEVGSLQLEAQFDDGFNVWINGVHVLSQNMPGRDVGFSSSASSALESLDFHSFTLPSPGSYLRRGANVISVQGHNASISGSSDFFMDFRLISSGGSSTETPTPAARNSVFSENNPPQIRQVKHSPKEPKGNEPVTITAKVTDPDGIADVILSYQEVDPGRYVELTDPSYAANWKTIAMNDEGLNGDALKGDDIYTAALPASIQIHRRLVRYRLTASDASGEAVVVPYADDPQPNFAYFVYDGVPDWHAAIRPGRTAVMDFSREVMGRLPAYHLISKRTAVERATWREQYRGDQYKWTGTLVYDGEVYDHIRYRARGGVWRYAMGKNMWKFDFKRGHSFAARDDYGEKHKTQWAKLNLGASIQQRDSLHRGEQGMFESVGFRLFNLAGVEAARTTFVTFRIIDDAIEANPANQFEGDFWGLYLATEQMGGRFLDEHNLPDGNLYKMENGTGPSGANGEIKNQGAISVTDYSDLTSFRRGYLNSNPSDNWWRSNLDLPRYYSYQAIIQGIHHYDVCCGKNYYYFQNPVTGLWQVHPWDLDLTWADNMYVGGVTGGTEPFQSRVLRRQVFDLEYRNRVREIRDLLFNSDQAWKLIDEYANLLRGSVQGPTILDADRSQWDYNPVMADSSIVNSNKAGQGRFYLQGKPTKDFAGMVQLMKDYVTYRSGRILDPMARDSRIPKTPTITGSVEGRVPINRLVFRAPSFTATTTLSSSIRWRVGEITDPKFPEFDPLQPRKYEIESVWESEPLRTIGGEISVPQDLVRVGRHYRVRAQVKDSTGRTSHWSAPIEITVIEPDTASELADYLRISEIMYNPPDGGEFEFIELHNASSDQEIDISGASFTRGIDYSFPVGTKIASDGYLLVVKADSSGDFGVFRNHYGLNPSVAITGPYVGSLANEGERVTLRTAQGGLEIVDFVYQDGQNWPSGADGSGASLVPLASTYSVGDGTSLNSSENWRDSARIGGSPGSADPASDGTIAGDFDFGIVEITNSELILEFSAMANTAYVVEFRDSLSTGSWLLLGEVPPQPLNGVRRVTDSNFRGDGARFYRVVGQR